MHISEDQGSNLASSQGKVWFYIYSKQALGKNSDRAKFLSSVPRMSARAAPQGSLSNALYSQNVLSS